MNSLRELEKRLRNEIQAGSLLLEPGPFQNIHVQRIFEWYLGPALKVQNARISSAGSTRLKIDGQTHFPRLRLDDNHPTRITITPRQQAGATGFDLSLEIEGFADVWRPADFDRRLSQSLFDRLIWQDVRLRLSSDYNDTARPRMREYEIQNGNPLPGDVLDAALDRTGHVPTPDPGLAPNGRYGFSLSSRVDLLIAAGDEKAMWGVKALFAALFPGGLSVEGVIEGEGEFHRAYMRSSNQKVKLLGVNVNLALKYYHLFRKIPVERISDPDALPDESVRDGIYYQEFNLFKLEGLLAGRRRSAGEKEIKITLGLLAVQAGSLWLDIDAADEATGAASGEALTLNDLISLLPGDLRRSLRSNGWIDLDDIRFQTMQIRLGEKLKPELFFAELSLKEETGFRFSFGDLLEVRFQKFSGTLEMTLPRDGGAYYDFSLACVSKIFSKNFYVKFYWPRKTFSARLDFSDAGQPESIDLFQLCRDLLGWAPEEQLECSGLTIDGDFENQEFSISGVVATGCALGPLRLESLDYYLFFRKDADPRVSLRGRLKIGSAAMTVALEQEDTGWALRGELQARPGATEASLNLSRIAEQFIPAGLKGDGFFIPEIQLESLGLVYRSSTGALQLTGRTVVNPEFTLLNQTYPTAFDVSFTIEPNGFDGFLSTQLKTDRLDLDLRVHLGDETRIAGTLTSRGKGAARDIDLFELPTLFGLSHAPLPKLPAGVRMKFRGATLDFAPAISRFFVQVKSSENETLFFTAKKINNDWKFALGLCRSRVNASQLAGYVGFARFREFKRLAVRNLAIVFASYEEDRLSPPQIGNVATRSPQIQWMEENPLLVRRGLNLSFDLDVSSDKTPEFKYLLRPLGLQEIRLHTVVTAGGAVEYIKAYLDADFELKAGGAAAIKLSRAAFVLYRTLGPRPRMIMGMEGTTSLSIGDQTYLPYVQLLSGPGELAVNANIKPSDRVQESDDAKPDRSFPPMPGYPGVRPDEIGVKLGKILSPPALVFGMQAKFHLQGQKKASNKLAAVFDVSKAPPIPLFLSFYFPEMNLRRALEIKLGAERAKQLGQAVPILDVFKAQDVFFYWAGSDQILPDGTMARVGTGFQAYFKLWFLQGYANFVFIPAQAGVGSGFEGAFEISPLNLFDLVQLKGAGAGKTIQYIRVDSVWRQESPADRESMGPEAYAAARKESRTLIRSGGPVGFLSPHSSPFLGLDLEVILFEALKSHVQAEGDINGFTFKLHESFLGQTVDLDCRLSVQGGFHAAGAISIGIDDIQVPETGFSFPVSAHFRGDLKIDLDKKQKRLSIKGKLSFLKQKISGFEIKFTPGPDAWEQLQRKLIDVIIDNTPELAELLVGEAEKIADQAREKAGEILAEATEQAERVIPGGIPDEVKDIAEAAADAVEEVEDLAGDVARKIKNIEKDIERIGKEALDAIEDIAGPAAEAFREAVKVGEAALKAAEKVADELLKGAEAGARAIIDAAEAALSEAKEWAAEARKIGERAAEETIKAAKVAAQAIREEGEKIAGEILDQARAIQRRAKKIWKEVRGILDALNPTNWF